MTRKYSLFQNKVSPIHAEPGQCPLPASYWKGNQSLWPLQSMMLGSETYQQIEMLELMASKLKNDESFQLARELIVAKLNLASGTSSSPIIETVMEADHLLASFQGKLPYGVDKKTHLGSQMRDRTVLLRSFNKGKLSRGCRK